MNTPFFFNKVKTLIQNKLWVDTAWYLIPLLAAFIKSFQGINNYLIYKGVYFHTLQKVNLFDFYPQEYADKNHYGILFALIIAPFTYLPDWMAILMYQALQLIGLNLAIRKLPISASKQNLMLLYILPEAIANCQNVQFNTFIAFVMVAAYVCIYRQKEFQAAFVTLLGFFVKLYGIVALGLFFFVKNKFRYMAGFLVSGIFLFFIPLLITDIDFLVQSYKDWFVELKSKNSTNTDLDNVHQNMSAIGLLMKVMQNNRFNILYMILPAFILQLAPLCRYRLFQHTTFQMRYLASLLLFIILFNTATETSTHIIGAVGIGIWWLSQTDYKSKHIIGFMMFVFCLGTLSTTDLVPKQINFEIIRKYSLKALPYLLVWLLCIKQLLLDEYLHFKETTWIEK